MLLFPPSLSPEVLERSFRARNGEVGVRLEDMEAFLTACERDQIEVLGWDLWLVDHAWDDATNRVRRVPVSGYWCELIPGAGHDLPGIYVGQGDADECRDDIGKIDFSSADLAPWRDFLRLRFCVVSPPEKPETLH